MATDVKNSVFDHNNSAESAASTVADIIRDAHELVSQQLALFRAEIREDLKKTRKAATPMILGVIVGFIGGVLLCLMLVQLLYWVNPNLTLWGSYAIVGAVLTISGAVLFFIGKERFSSINPLPEKTAQSLKENLQWTSQPK
jgi:hypothetical protein